MAGLSAKQFDHFVPRIVDVDFHGMASFGGLMRLDCAENVAVSNPAGMQPAAFTEKEEKITPVV